MEGDFGKLRRTSSKIKTYSRRSSHNIEEPSSKRRRIEETSSTEVQLPPVKTVKRVSITDYFKSTQPSSDSIEAHSTPPSSPPQVLPSETRTRVKRRLTTRPHLPAINNMDDSPNSSAKLTPGAVTRTLPIHTIQTQLAPTRVTCEECKMVYDNAVPSDVRTHEKFHKEMGVFQGLSINKGILLWSETSETGVVSSIRAMDRNCNPAWRSDFEEALEWTYDNGLSARPIRSEDLWSACPDPHDPENPILMPKYKFFIKTIDNHIVGLVLAKLAKESGWWFNGIACIGLDGWSRYAKEFLPVDDYTQQFILHDESRPAYMSVDHLWVAASHRRTGCATQLVDYARDHFILGRKLTHEDICFSIPTLEGEKFARMYCAEKIDYGKFDFPHTDVRVNLAEYGQVVKDGRLQGDEQNHLASLVPRLEPFQDWN